MKKQVITFFFLLIFKGLAAQTNFYKLSIGGNVGINYTFTDSRKMLFSFSKSAEVDYNLTRFTNVGFEVQNGKLRGGEIGSRPFQNNYTSFSLNGKVQLGEILNDAQLNTKVFGYLKGAYIGAGVGIINNNVSTPEPIYEKIVPKSKEVIIPFNFGINFHLEDKWGRTPFLLNFNSQTIFSLEDGIDGDPNPSSNINDIYSFLSIGLRYNFGFIGLERKRPGRFR